MREAAQNNAKKGERAWAWMQRPCVTAALVLGLCLHTWHVNSLTPRRHGTLLRALFPCFSTHCFFSDTAEVFSEADGSLAFAKRGDDDSLHLQSDPNTNKVAEVLISSRSCSTLGVWAPTKVDCDYTPKLTDLGMSPTQRAVVWNELDDRVVSGEIKPWFRENYDLWRSGVTRTSTVIVSGYVHNAIALWLLGLTLFSFKWLVEAHRESDRKAIRAWRREQDRCLACGYDMAGLLSSVCPECGTDSAASAI